MPTKRVSFYFAHEAAAGGHLEVLNVAEVKYAVLFIDNKGLIY